MIPCPPLPLIRQIRRAAPAKATGTGAATVATGAVRRVSRPLRVCRDAGALSVVAAGPMATPAEAPPPRALPRGGPEPPGAGAGGVPNPGIVQGGGSGGGAPAPPADGPGPIFALIPGEVLFGANLPPGPGEMPAGEIGGVIRVPEVPPPYPAEVAEPPSLLWLPLALGLVLLLHRLRAPARAGPA